MALKYWFEYLDIENIEYRCEISSTSFSGDSTEITGKCILEYPQVKDHFTAIRGANMTMLLDANLDLPFDDLSTENDRVYKVELLRDSSTIFVGFINPEGIYEDWVNDRWTMDVFVTGGLGFLENMSYVDDSGLPFIEDQTPLEIIVNCLKRTELDLNINVSLDFEYVGFVGTDEFDDEINVINELTLRTDRYIREDSDTIMDCKEVLVSILNIFNACICQMDGEWWIFKTSAILRPTDGQTFFAYDSDGVPQLNRTKSISTRQIIGSHINGATIFHCNGNQRKERKSTLSAFKVNYVYGLTDTVFVNEFMEYALGAIEGWSFINASEFLYSPYNGTSYVTLRDYRGADAIYSGDTPLEIIRTDDVSVSEGEFFSFDIETIENKYINAVSALVLFDDGTTTYYLNVTTGWIPVGSTPILDQIIFLENIRNNVDDTGSYTIRTAAMPADGTMTFSFYNSRSYWPFDTGTHYTYLTRFIIYPSADNTINGEFHTVQRDTVKSNRVDDVLQVYNGDNDSVIYYGTIYKADGETQTDLWKRDFLTESKPLLQLVAEERLRLYSGVQIVFSGDIYGYIPYLSKVLIDNVDGEFMPLFYRHDTQSNIISLILHQGYTDEISDITYEYTIDYGNVVKPTIKG